MEMKQLESIIRGPIEDNFGIGERIDGKYNLWQRVVQVDPEDKSTTMFWQVIEVIDGKSDAECRQNAEHRLSKIIQNRNWNVAKASPKLAV